MAELTPAQRDAIVRAFNSVGEWIAKLHAANEQRESDTRSNIAQRLFDAQDVIGSSGVLDGTGPAETQQEAVFQAGESIVRIIEAIEDDHELAIMALGTDIAELITKLGLSAYTQLFRGFWGSERRAAHHRVRATIPEKPPQDVEDDFSILLFNQVQGALNLRAFRLKPITPYQCLNGDDYGPGQLNGIVLKQIPVASRVAIDNYLDLQALTAAAKAARDPPEPSIFGEIWSIVGWDSPWDFLTDAVFFVATGGASKLARWTSRLAKATTRMRRGVHEVEAFIRLERRVEKMRERIEEVHRLADAVRKARNLTGFPAKLLSAFEKMRDAQAEFDFLDGIRKKVQPDYVRTVVSGVGAAVFGPADTHVAGTASFEAARMACLAFMKSSPLSKMIEDAKGQISYTNILASGIGRFARKIFLYWVLLLCRELIVRVAINTARKRTITVDIFVDNVLSSAFNAFETVFIDVPFMSAVKAREWARTCVSTIRKWIASMAQKAAHEWVQ